ncbi:hypothetical protein ACZ90_39210 [Streptomyces albus subsp. albus]|nr:hypothetical protein ACZ90_39210 [Streptomyces albus subsp. albus]
MNSAPTEPVLVRRARPAEEAEPVRVLLLHGLASGAAVWNGFTALADPAYELWTAELPWRGSGVPGWPDRPADDWVAQAVAALPGPPDIVVGHSFGANALLAWLARAETAGHAPRGVVLVSPFYRSQQEQFDWDAISYYLNHFDRILSDGLRVSSGGRLEPSVQQDMALKVRERIGPYGWMRFFETYLGTPRLPIDRMLMPFLIIGGETDFAAFPNEAEALGQVLPDAEVRILPGVGHFTMVERAAEFSEAVNGFLSTVTARPRPGASLSAMEYN